MTLSELARKIDGNRADDDTAANAAAALREAETLLREVQPIGCKPSVWKRIQDLLVNQR